MFTIATDEDESKRIGSTTNRLEEDCLIMITIPTSDIEGTCQRWVILNGRWDGM